MIIGGKMIKELSVGLIIADDSEYAALLNVGGIDFKECNFNKHQGHKFCFKNGEKTISVWAVCCKTGMVNAAITAQHIIDTGAKVLVNYGLSGGLQNVARGEDVVGTAFFEHDFDLTCLGYGPCEKPGQEYIYYAKPSLVELALKAASPAKSGKMASGDCFVSDKKLRDLLKDKFDAMCCDMETAAIASAAYFSDIPFISLRRVSDGAGDEAADDYRQMNDGPQEAVAEKALNIIKALFNEKSLWV